MTLTTQFLILVSMMILCIGCAVYAPPVRVTHGGAPAKIRSNEMDAELSGAQLFYHEPPGVSGQVGYGVSDYIVLEGGLGGQVKESSMGFAGIRFVPWPLSKQKTTVKLTTDLELGGGLGVGGRLETPYNWEDDGYGEDWQDLHGDSLSWYQRFAGGGYAGFGLGFNVKWFDMFARGRYQISRATHIPTTHFFSALGGFEFSFPKGFKFYFGAGPVYYLNNLDSSFWGFGEIGLSYTFGL